MGSDAVAARARLLHIQALRTPGVTCAFMLAQTQARREVEQRRLPPKLQQRVLTHVKLMHRRAGSTAAHGAAPLLQHGCSQQHDPAAHVPLAAARMRALVSSAATLSGALCQHLPLPFSCLCPALPALGMT